MLSDTLIRVEGSGSWGSLLAYPKIKLVEESKRVGPDVCLRFISGTDSCDEEAFFNTVSKSLSFPSYNGNNWSALDDSLHDMQWLQSKKYVFVITDADKFLADSDVDSLDTFLEIAKSAHDDWADPSSDGYLNGWTDKPVSMYFVFQSEPLSKDLLLNRYEARGLKLL